MNILKNKIYNILRWSEKWMKTDMVYIAKGGFWLSLGQVFSSISSFLIAAAFANLLPKETYGTYKYVLSLFGILSITTLQEMGTSYAQAVARGLEGNFYDVIKNKIKWGSLGSLGALIFSLYYFFNTNYTLSLSLAIIAVFIPIFNGFYLYLPFLSGKKMFDKAMIYEIVAKIISTLFVLAAIILSKNIFIILISYFAPLTIIRICFLNYTKNKYKPNNLKDGGVVSYGKHLSVMEILQTLAGEADKILTFHYLGPAQLAIYSVASAPIGQIKSSILNIKSLAFPKLSQAKADDIKKSLPKLILKAEMIIIPMVIVYIFLAPFLFKTIFPQYGESVLYTQILAVTLLLIPRALLSSSLSAKKQVKELYKIRIYGPIGKLLIMLFLIKFYGLLGLIISRVLSEIYYVILYNFYFKRIKDV